MKLKYQKENNFTIEQAQLIKQAVAIEVMACICFMNIFPMQPYYVTQIRITFSVIIFLSKTL